MIQLSKSDLNDVIKQEVLCRQRIYPNETVPVIMQALWERYGKNIEFDTDDFLEAIYELINSGEIKSVWFSLPNDPRVKYILFHPDAKIAVEGECVK